MRGFVIARQRGSHIVMRRGSAGCVVLNHTRESDLTLVRVGDERYEIPDAVLYDG